MEDIDRKNTDLNDKKCNYTLYNEKKIERKNVDENKKFFTS